MNQDAKTRSPPSYQTMDLWKHTKVLLQDLDDTDMQTNLEFFLYQEHLNLEEMQTLHGLVLYLLAKQDMTNALEDKLDTLTKNFVQFIHKP